MEITIVLTGVDRNLLAVTNALRAKAEAGYEIYLAQDKNCCWYLYAVKPPANMLYSDGSWEVHPHTHGGVIGSVRIKEHSRYSTTLSIFGPENSLTQILP